MVKGKTYSSGSKVQNVKKACSKAGSAPSPSQALSRLPSKAASTQSFWSLPSCCSCGSLVGEDTKSLQCDRCISTEILKCAECLNLTGEMYDHLVSEPNSLLRWFCDNCEKVVMDKNSTTLGNQSEKIDHLIVAIEKMMVWYEVIETKLENKYDWCEADRFETVIWMIK